MNRLTHKPPTTIEIDGIKYNIDTDFRNCLLIIMAYEDNNIFPEERAEILLENLYSINNDEEIKLLEIRLKKLINGLKELENYNNKILKSNKIKKEHKEKIIKLKKDIKNTQIKLDKLIKENYTLPKTLTNFQKAIELGFKFLDCDRDFTKIKSQERLYCFSQDSEYINSAIPTKIELDEIDYMHWWTFISKFMAIGESFFSRLIYFRTQQQKAKLTKEESIECENIGWQIINLKQNYQINEAKLDDEFEKYLQG